LLQFYRKQQRDFDIQNEHFKIYVDYRNGSSTITCRLRNGDLLFEMHAFKLTTLVNMSHANHRYMKIRDYSPFIKMLTEEKKRIEQENAVRAMEETSRYSRSKELYLNTLNP
jgi:hypothetical protein